MKVNSVLTTTPLPKVGVPVRPSFGWEGPVGRWLLSAALAAAVAVPVGYEIRTSGLEARLLPQYAATLSYELASGPSDSIVFPHAGPFDDRRGYSRIGEFQSRLETQGFQVDRQMRFSPGLMRLISWGITPPYREPPVAGLVIRGQGGVPLF